MKTVNEIPEYAKEIIGGICEMLLRVERSGRRDQGDVDVAVTAFEMMISHAAPICGGFLPDESAYYVGFTLSPPAPVPPIITDDDSDMNESATLIRTIDLPLDKTRGVKVRGFVVAFSVQAADAAEVRMRAGVGRLRAQIKRTQTR